MKPKLPRRHRVGRLTMVIVNWQSTSDEPEPWTSMYLFIFWRTYLPDEPARATLLSARNSMVNLLASLGSRNLSLLALKIQVPSSWGSIWKISWRVTSDVLAAISTPCLVDRNFSDLHAWRLTCGHESSIWNCSSLVMPGLVALSRPVAPSEVRYLLLLLDLNEMTSPWKSRMKWVDIAEASSVRRPVASRKLPFTAWIW